MPAGAAHGIGHRVVRQTDQPGDIAKRDHVGASARYLLRKVLHRQLREVLHRQRQRSGTGVEHDGGRLALAGIADHDAAGVELDFVGEAREIDPVDGDQQVEPVGMRVDR
jgi:hypothetical protein